MPLVPVRAAEDDPAIREAGAEARAGFGFATTGLAGFPAADGRGRDAGAGGFGVVAGEGFVAAFFNGTSTTSEPAGLTRRRTDPVG